MNEPEQILWNLKKLRASALKTSRYGECRIDTEMLVGIIDQHQSLLDDLKAAEDLVKALKVRVAFVGHPGEPWRGDRTKAELLGDNGPDWSEVCAKAEDLQRRLKRWETL